jgi:hypothetical protein
MIKTTAAISTALLTLASTSVFAQARVAVAHFAPFADTVEGTAVNISVNGTPVDALQGVVFKQFTDYIDFDEGEYTIDVIPVGATEPAITGTFNLTDGMSYTVYAAGDGAKQSLELRALVDDTTMPGEGNLNLRIVHAAPFAADLDATAVSVRTDDGTVVAGLSNVPYNVDSGFLEVPAGTYDLKVASPDGSVNYFDIAPAALPAGADVTVYAVGDLMNQPLGAIAFPVGELALEGPVDDSTNGIFEIIQGSGTGFNFFPIPAQNRATGQWFTYDKDGNPIFYTFDSCQLMDGACSNPGGFDGMMATTDLYLNTGGGSSEDDVVTTEKVGEIFFEWDEDSCLTGTAEVTLDGEMPEQYDFAALVASFCNE